MDKINIDLRGLNPAPVTPFNRDGSIDFAAIKRLGSWLAGIDGVKSLTVLGHAGEGTYLDREEQVEVIRAFVEAVDNRIPIIAGITLEGSANAANEAKRAVQAGAKAGLLYPPMGGSASGTRRVLPRTGTEKFMKRAAFPSSFSSIPMRPNAPTISRPSWTSPPSPVSSP